VNRGFAVLLVLLFALNLLFPSDAPWRGDDANFIHLAFEANAHPELPVMGQSGGSTGLQYGSLATWVYRGFLKVTQDLLAILTVKIALSWLLTCGALLAVARLYSLRRGPLLLVFLSPYLFLFHRMYWDNAFLIPLSALLFWSTSSFFFRPSRGAFASTCILVSLLFQTHPLSSLMLVPLVFLFVVGERAWITANLRWVILVGLLTLFLTLPCLKDLVASALAPKPPRDFRFSPEGALLHVLTGIHIFSFVGFPSYFMETYVALLPVGILLPLMAATLLGALPFFPAIYHTSKSLRLGRPLSPIDKNLLWLAGSCLLALVVFPFFGLHAHPHYHNADWTLFFFFIWLGWDRASTRYRRYLIN
jgi:hypothetical protein